MRTETLREPEATPNEDGDSGYSLGRRALLIGGAVALGSVVVGAPLQGLVSNVGGAIASGTGVSALSSLLPGGGGFRYYTVTGGYPLIKVADFRLEVGGRVRRPTTIDYAMVTGLAQTELVSEFQCVTGWIVPNVHWRGVALADILSMAGVINEGDSIEFYSSDGAYTESLTMTEARDLGALVATHMNGKPLSQAHGGPVRLFVPKMYGYKSIKWLSRISVVKSATPGYWEQRGYPVDATIGSSVL